MLDYDRDKVSAWDMSQSEIGYGKLPSLEMDKIVAKPS